MPRQWRDTENKIYISFSLDKSNPATQRILAEAERLSPKSIHQVCRDACLQMYSGGTMVPPAQQPAPVASAPRKEEEGIDTINLLQNGGAFDDDF